MLGKTIKDIIVENGCENIEIVSGHCVGAGRLGELYAEKHNAQVKIFPAAWEKYGKRAGSMRNKQMVDYISSFKNKIVESILRIFINLTVVLGKAQHLKKYSIVFLRVSG